MDRIDKIIKHKSFIKSFKQIQKAEKNRIFCGHDMVHFMDVARIAMILNLEEGIGIAKDIIYATALLHDIGRSVEYEKGIPHEQASVPIAKVILTESSFDKDEIEVIIEAILNHRNKSVAKEHNLSSIIYRADKCARACFGCVVEQECNWDKKKKNLKITY
ncbi:HD domain-containing protein [Lachnospiraceae bacterium OttesenSCG-928-D06]|nr:HD domain-containing protein [Lachnospiraceae bacterium OttesenSCG-928-D06]